MRLSQWVAMAGRRWKNFRWAESFFGTNEN